MISNPGLTHSVIRETVIDFTIGVMDDPITIVKRKANRFEMNFTAYLFIFTPKAWIAIVIAIIVLAIMLICISNKLKMKLHCHKDSEKFGFLNALAYVLVLLLQRDYIIAKKTVSTRIISFVTCLFAFLIFVYYSSFLTSFMATKSVPDQIKSFEDVLDQDLDLILWIGSSYEQVMKDAEPQSAMNKVKNRNFTLWLLQ